MRAILALALSGLLFMSFNWQQSFSGLDHKSLEDSTLKIDSTTNLIIDTGHEMVIAHCTGCHSSKIITNFRADRNRWQERIKWMQKTQKLWDLGEAEPIVLTYLAKNYGPQKKQSSREPLKKVNWYILK